MPPRFAYWTILIDNAPTAFRARDRDELLPTVTQLKRTNSSVELKWFAQGKLWDSPEAQRAAWRTPKPPRERRDRDWRPGGAHKDPRARFDKEARRRNKRETRERWNGPREPVQSPAAREGAGTRKPAGHGARGGGRWTNRPAHKPAHFSGGTGQRPPFHRGPGHGARPAPRTWPKKDRRRRRDDEPPDKD